MRTFVGPRRPSMLGLSGKPFWQDESYDQLVRSDAESERIRAYIESNPVKAGLATEANFWQWSSAGEGAA